VPELLCVLEGEGDAVPVDVTEPLADELPVAVALSDTPIVWLVVPVAVPLRVAVPLADTPAVRLEVPEAVPLPVCVRLWLLL